MDNRLNSINRVKAATAMSSSIRFLTNRDFLNDIALHRAYLAPQNKYEDEDNYCGTHWLQIHQIGRQQLGSVHQYFATIQKVLLSCHAPHLKKLLFLIKGDKEKVNVYLGIRSYCDDCSVDGYEFMQNLSSYIKNIWSGTNTQYIDDPKNAGPGNCISSNKLKKIYALTGIPSFTKREGEENLTSIDKLLGTLSQKEFAYLIVANPIEENHVSAIINQCNEMAGQLESVKSFNFSEGINRSEQNGTTHTTGQTNGETYTNSQSGRRDSDNLLLGGLTLASGMLFGPAACTIPLVTCSGFFKQNSTSNGTTKTFSEQFSTNHSLTEGQSESLSQTIVNRHVEYALKRLNSQLERFEEGLGEGMWRTSVYLLTEDEDTAVSASMQLKSIVSGKNSHLEPIRLHPVSKLRGDDKFTTHGIYAYKAPCVAVMYKNPQSAGPDIKIHNPFEEIEYSELSTLLTTEELSCYINFPQKSIPGISVVEGAPDFSLNRPSVENSKSISIGNLLYANAETEIPLSLPIDLLSKHSLVAGVNGSGKTNTILKILSELGCRKLPFLVIEPAKTEYVEWAIKYNKTLALEQKNGLRRDEKPIRIFMPGKTTYQRGELSSQVESLRINPFEVITLGSSLPDASAVLAHIDRIKSTFAAAFPMYDILPVVMETLLYHLYTRAEHWLTNPPAENRHFPTMSLMSACIDGVIDSLGYEQKNRDNIAAAMNTRINSLLRGWKKDLLDNEILQGISWKELFESRCVINLSMLGDDVDRSFVMSVLLQFLYEYRIAEATLDQFSYDSNQLRHLIVLEEAHRIMTYNANVDSPQAKCGALFSNMLSEIRAYGQGMMIVDQIPSRLIPDAIKNTNLKIIHRLISADDIRTIAESVGMTDEQQKIIAKLGIGQTVVSGIQSETNDFSFNQDIYWCKVKKMK